MTTATTTTPAYYRAGGTGVLRRFRGNEPGEYWDDKIRCWIAHEWAFCDWGFDCLKPATKEDIEKAEGKA